MPKIKTPATIDYETHGIEYRPEYPPKPVGVAIWEPGKSPKYMSWGHPCENNCTKSEAVKYLKSIYSKYPILCHNAKFDLDVGNTHMGLPLIPKYGYHDTQFLAFFDNPHSPTLALKELSEIYLDIPPDEQDELYDWIENNLKQDFGPFSKKKNPPGKYIAYAPAKLVGKYAKGDVIRTRKLFDLLYKKVVTKRGMLEPYERELRLMPVLLENERGGIKINSRGLKKDSDKWRQGIDDIDSWIRKKTKTKGLNVDSNEELADALDSSGFIDEWVLTPKGNRSVSKDNLPQAINNQQILNVLAYRSKLDNAVSTFAEPWLRMADRNNGLVNFIWAQVRNSNSGNMAGARTGRLQSSPNLLNVPKEIEKDSIPALPTALSKIICEMPNMRKYIIPDSKDHIFGHRDYSQQELRILAHFEDGDLLEAYNANPNLDMHDLAKKLVSEMLMRDIPRKPIKNMGFGILYGMGITKLSKSMGVDLPEGKQLKNAYLGAFPGLKYLIRGLEERCRDGFPITTWGGRQYYVEEPKYNHKDGRLQTFEYKMLNYLIQGSAADCTKEAIIRIADACKNSRMLISVHDEINMSIPKECFWDEMKLMKEAMNSVEFDVPMLSDGGKSSKNWASVKDFTKQEIKKYGV